LAILSDLGCHIDGFIAVTAHTIVVGANKDKKVDGRKADVILAAYNAAEAALRLLKPGSNVRLKYTIGFFFLFLIDLFFIS
jgi:methionine aminopeptidase